jgi:hypothetical protein
MTEFERLETIFKTEKVSTQNDVYVKDIPEDIFYYIKDSVFNILDTTKMFQKSNKPLYETLGLTYNPNLSIPGEEQYSRNIDLGENGRDDTHAYVRPLPKSEFLYNICEYTPVRAKITRMEGNYESSEWHYDEPLNECIKVIIPIATDPQCLFQIDNRKPVNLQVGKAYLFNSYFHHRYLLGNCQKPIIHLVVGLSTKYEYDYYNNQWVEANRDLSDPLNLIDKSLIF